MSIIRNFLLIILPMLLVSGCSIPHYIEKDYPQYLVNNAGTANLPNTGKADEYFLTSDTQNHSYEFRAVVTGYAHLWIVEFGKILDDTLQSTDVQNAFGILRKVSEQSSNQRGILIFDLHDYTFEDFGAHISLKISLSQEGQIIFSKTYQQDGKTQGGKMFWAGAFGQKNAVQQSTKLALDEILRQLISDLNAVET